MNCDALMLMNGRCGMEYLVSGSDLASWASFTFTASLCFKNRKKSAGEVEGSAGIIYTGYGVRGSTLSTCKDEVFLLNCSKT
jgi:hypothetical protein